MPEGAAQWAQIAEGGTMGLGRPLPFGSQVGTEKGPGRGEPVGRAQYDPLCGKSGSTCMTCVIAADPGFHLDYGSAPN